VIRSHFRKTFHLLLLFILAAGVFASGLDASGKAKNPLWRVSSDKGAVYLLGSIHLLKPSDYPLSKAIEEAYNSSEAVVFELDISESTTGSAKAMMREYVQFGKSGSLKRSLSAGTYGMLQKAFRKRGMDIGGADNLKPWYVATILTVSELQGLGFMAEHGVDMHYFRRAATSDKDIMALETLEYQLGLFNGLSLEAQDAFVRQTLKDISTIKNDFPAIVGSWRTGDTKGLLKLLESCKDFRETCRRIIDKRNMDWLPRIEALLKSGRPAIVIVGAAHMVGKGGLISLLKKRGYRVEQL
jgi:uncharacterized protein YbaP (TraB family)